MKLRTKILLGALAAFAALQLVRPEKNLGVPAPFAGRDDITAHHPTPPEVRRLLAVACYDCHSDHTRYPWYASVQPLAWWLADHVKDGRRALNLSRFAAYPAKRQAEKLEALADEVRDRAMPLRSYTWAHGDARLTAADRKTLCDWPTASATGSSDGAA